MIELPKPKRMSLSASLSYIAKKTKIIFINDDVYNSLHRALCENDIVVTGYKYDYSGKKNEEPQAIPAKLWEQYDSRILSKDTIYVNY